MQEQRGYRSHRFRGSREGTDLAWIVLRGRQLEEVEAWTMR